MIPATAAEAGCLTDVGVVILSLRVALFMFFFLPSLTYRYLSQERCHTLTSEFTATLRPRRADPVFAIHDSPSHDKIPDLKLFSPSTPATNPLTPSNNPMDRPARRILHMTMKNTLPLHGALKSAIDRPMGSPSVHTLLTQSWATLLLQSLREF